MKKDYISPKVNVEEFKIKEEVTALTVSTNALNWGTTVEDSVDWE